MQVTATGIHRNFGHRAIPGALDDSHAVEKDCEILVLFDVFIARVQIRSENHSGGLCSAASEWGDDELLINSLKTAFV